jgi:hypothetical protein
MVFELNYNCQTYISYNKSAPKLCIINLIEKARIKQMKFIFAAKRWTDAIFETVSEDVWLLSSSENFAIAK